MNYDEWVIQANTNEDLSSRSSDFFHIFPTSLCTFKTSSDLNNKANQC